jgi:hypothetical protein
LVLKSRPLEALPMPLLTHLTQIFAISDLIFLLAGIGMLGMLVVIARMS